MSALARKFIILFFAFAVIFVYSIYSYLSVVDPKVENRDTRESHRQHDHDDHGVEITNIRHKLVSNAQKIEVTEDTIELTFKEKNVRLHVKECTVDKRNKPILFLHGASFSSENWKDMSTLKLVAAMGYRAIAIDLPGWARSKATPVVETDEFLQSFIEFKKLDRPIIVTPSMSGSYAIPYLMRPNPSTCQERASAFVALAPVQTSEFTHAQYHQCEIPALIVYGTKDRNLGLQSVGNLRNMPKSKVVPMEDAGHACYIERPDEFHKILYNFLVSVNPDMQ